MAAGAPRDTDRPVRRAARGIAVNERSIEIDTDDRRAETCARSTRARMAARPSFEQNLDEMDDLDVPHLPRMAEW